MPPVPAHGSHSWILGPIEGGEDQLLTGDRLQDVSWTTARICGTNRNQDHSEDRGPNQCFFFRKLVHDNTTSAGGPIICLTHYTDLTSRQTCQSCSRRSSSLSSTPRRPGCSASKCRRR